MARDFKHGIGEQKAGFQRRSQQSDHNQSRPEGAGSKLLFIFVLLTGIFVGGFVVVNHFATQGIKGEKLLRAVEPVEPLNQVVDLPELTDEPSDLISDDQGEAAQVDNSDPTMPSEASSTLVVDSVQPDQFASNPIEYSFYKGLAETEVVVDAEPIPIDLPVPYFIQAGSFADESRAMKEKKRLLKYGFDLEVSGLETKKGMYYRLRLGPFTNRLKLNKQRNALKALGVDTLPIKSK